MRPDKAAPELREDPTTGLAIPAADFDAKRKAWLEPVIEMLKANKLDWRFNAEENGITVTRHKRGSLNERLTFNAGVEMTSMPPEVWFQFVHQWSTGFFRADNVLRILTPEEQARVIERFGRKPLKPGFTDKLTNEVRRSKLVGGDNG